MANRKADTKIFGALAVTDTYAATNSDNLRAVGGRAYVNAAASTAISNTTTATNFSLTYDIPAGTLKVGTVVNIRWQGIATATNGSDTLAIRSLIDTTALTTGTATNVADNDIFYGDIMLVCRTAGSSGTFVMCGIHTDVPAAGDVAIPLACFLASTAVDTAQALTVAVEATWSVASASNSVRLDVLYVEIV